MRQWVWNLGTALIVAALAGCTFVPPEELATMRQRLQLNLPQVVRYADLSAAAYVPRNVEPSCKDAPVVALRIPCFSVLVQGSSRPHNAIYLLDSSGDVQVVAVRGTANGGDALIDLDTRRSKDTQLAADVHSGFQRVAQAIYTDIRDNGRLDPGKPVILTGHSLGGATALVLGLYMIREVRAPEYKVQKIYTYGQPKVFSSQDASDLYWLSERELVLRVVNCGDPVSIVPVSESWWAHFLRFDWFTNNRLTDYQHVGRFLMLMPDGRFWLPGYVDVERELPRAATRTLSGALAAETNEHSMELYVDRLARLSSAPPADTSNRPAADAAARYVAGSGAARIDAQHAKSLRPDGRTPCAVPAEQRTEKQIQLGSN